MTEVTDRHVLGWTDLMRSGQTDREGLRAFVLDGKVLERNCDKYYSFFSVKKGIQSSSQFFKGDDIPWTFSPTLCPTGTGSLLKISLN